MTFDAILTIRYRQVCINCNASLLCIIQNRQRHIITMTRTIKDNQVYAARQPIIGNDGALFGYELLYRNSEQNCFPIGMDPEISTLRVVAEQMLFKNPMTDSVKAFINFNYSSLIDLIPTLLNPSKVVIEVLETCEPTTELLFTIKRLHQEGYSIALDDFEGDLHSWEKFFPYIKFIKIDISEFDIPVAKSIIGFVNAHYNIEFIAERIETHEQLVKCTDAGFNYYQGFYFSAPKVFSRSTLTFHGSVALSAHKLLMQKDVDLDSVASMIRCDVGLSARLLSYLTSCSKTKVAITSISQAVKYIGIENTRRFIMTVLYSQNHGSLSPHVMSLSITRSKFMSAICEHLKNSSISIDECYLTGLFSTLPNLTGNEWQTLANELSIHVSIIRSIDDHSTPVGKILALAIAFENTDHEYIEYSVKTLDLVDVEMVFGLYKDAVKSADNFMNSHVSNTKEKSVTDMTTYSKKEYI